MSTSKPEAAAVEAPLTRFVRLCVPLTGFGAYDLHGTGMAQLYLDTARREVGAKHFADFLDVWEELLRTGQGPVQLPALERELGRALVYLWYTGAWPRLAPAVHAELRRERPNAESMASPTSYPEGLVWRSFGGHPAGAKPPGFGTWADDPPVLPAEAEIAREVLASSAAYDPADYGPSDAVAQEVPGHLLPGARTSRSVPPSAVPFAAPHPEPVREEPVREEGEQVSDR
ncbi:hypothetical protein ACH4SP_09105 [Streptomyces sp. NPDC021093]|uniref:hypothetical protein n=1 Tax=Streptomyces sp. NPDC021093 TaxID=3365112 RepID=UPI0037B485C0